LFFNNCTADTNSTISIADIAFDIEKTYFTAMNSGDDISVSFISPFSLNNSGWGSTREGLFLDTSDSFGLFCNWAFFGD
jgi:hypothetical protein